MKTLPKPLALAINYINQVMETECIFCFGTRSSGTASDSLFALPQENSTAIHFDLLAITTNRCPLPDFFGRLENIPGIEITLSLIVRTHAALHKALKENNRFFHAIVKNARLVDARPGLAPVTNALQFDVKADQRATLAYWKTRYSNAITYSALALNSSNANDVALPLLRKSLEQACLGLIYVFMGYQPKDYALEALLQLCHSIDSRFLQVLLAVTGWDCFNYQIAEPDEWDKNDEEILESTVLEIHQCCLDFIRLAKELCEVKIHSIELK